MPPIPLVSDPAPVEEGDPIKHQIASLDALVLSS
jgi:hypothetical protein